MTTDAQFLDILTAAHGRAVELAGLARSVGNTERARRYERHAEAIDELAASLADDYYSGFAIDPEDRHPHPRNVVCFTLTRETTTRRARQPEVAE